MLVSLKPTYDEFQKLFSNSSVIKVLIALYQMNNKKSSATKIASILGIHITTAKTHLKNLKDHGFLVEEIANNQPGRPTYYTLTSDQSLILLDYNVMSETIDFNISIPNVLLREEKGLYPRIQFIYGENKTIKSIKIKKRTKAHRTITRNLILTDDEGRFLRYIPHPTMEPCSLLEICEQANISGQIRIRSIYDFVVKLRDLRIVKLVE